MLDAISPNRYIPPNKKPPRCKKILNLLYNQIAMTSNVFDI